MRTKSAGIRELKAHLSSYMKNVKNGEELLVSERGKAIARIVPVGVQLEHSRLHSLLLKLAREGKIILPESYRPPSFPKLRKKHKGSPMSDAVLESRR